MIKEKKVDSGAYGEIFRCIVDGNKTCALKRVKIENLSDTVVELGILCSIRHPHILHCLYTPIITSEHIDMVMPLADGNLRDYIAEKGGIVNDVTKLYRWINQLSQAIYVLHTNDIIHADIKTANVLVKDNNLILCDFSMGIQKNSSWSKYTHTSTTITHRPLEAFMCKIFPGKYQWDEGQDIWSLGVAFYEMTYGQQLFQFNKGTTVDGSDHEATADSIRALLDWAKFDSTVDQEVDLIKDAILFTANRTTKYYKPRISPQFNDPTAVNNMMRCMLRLDPQKRIVASQLLAHDLNKTFDIIPYTFISLRRQPVPQLEATMCVNANVKCSLHSIDLLSKIQEIDMSPRDRAESSSIISSLITGQDIPQPSKNALDKLLQTLEYVGFRVFRAQKQ